MHVGRSGGFGGGWLLGVDALGGVLGRREAGRQRHRVVGGAVLQLPRQLLLRPLLRELHAVRARLHLGVVIVDLNLTVGRQRVYKEIPAGLCG